MKPTNANLAKFYNVHRHTVSSYKNNKFRLYLAMKNHFIEVHKDKKIET